MCREFSSPTVPSQAARCIQKEHLITHSPEHRPQLGSSPPKLVSSSTQPVPTWNQVKSSSHPQPILAGHHSSLLPVASSWKWVALCLTAPWLPANTASPQLSVCLELLSVLLPGNKSPSMVLAERSPFLNKERKTHR